MLFKHNSEVTLVTKALVMTSHSSLNWDFKSQSNAKNLDILYTLGIFRIYIYIEYVYTYMYILVSSHHHCKVAAVTSISGHIYWLFILIFCCLNSQVDLSDIQIIKWCIPFFPVDDARNTTIFPLSFPYKSWPSLGVYPIFNPHRR